MKAIRGFASDNCSGIHPNILQALLKVNEGHMPSYGNDMYTCSVVTKFQEHFGPHSYVYFVWGGTAANVLGLAAVTRPYNSIICAETAHINVSECGAPEKFTGCKLLTIPSDDGKITVDQCMLFLKALGNQQKSQPKVISITQPTEYGTLYSVEEIHDLAEFARHHDMLLHMDGARVATAAVSLNVDLRSITTDAGVDVLSFGGTKSGMMCGEAVIFFNKELSSGFKFIRKQGMQLFSKMRFIAAQFEALLSDDLIYIIARHSNRMAQLLAGKLESIPDIKITHKVESNAVFAIIPPRCVEELKRRFDFHVWNEKISQVRLMTSFDTTEEDVELFVEAVRNTIEEESVQ